MERLMAPRTRSESKQSSLQAMFDAALLPLVLHAGTAGVGAAMPTRTPLFAKLQGEPTVQTARKKESRTSTQNSPQLQRCGETPSVSFLSTEETKTVTRCNAAAESEDEDIESSPMSHDGPKSKRRAVGANDPRNTSKNTNRAEPTKTCPIHNL